MSEHLDLCSVYCNLLYAMWSLGNVVPCPDWNTECLELTNVSFTCQGGSHRDRIPKYGVHTPDALKKYLGEMLYGTLDWAVREGKEAYTYHDRMVGQCREALDILRENPSSRRAVITIRRPDDITMDDQPCLTMIQLLIRNGQLNMTTYFRSNDLWEATYMNAYALMSLQETWAALLGVDAGDYTQMIGSLHVYKKNYGELSSAVQRIKHGNGDNTYIPADEFWEALK